MFGFHLLLCTLIIERNKKCRGYGEGYTIQMEYGGLLKLQAIDFCLSPDKFFQI